MSAPCPRCSDLAPNVCTCLAFCGHDGCAQYRIAYVCRRSTGCNGGPRETTP